MPGPRVMLNFQNTEAFLLSLNELSGTFVNNTLSSFELYSVELTSVLAASSVIEGG
jgi:hypothetical protein